MKWIIGEPSQENVYTYSYWNKIWNGSLVNPVKKMYIPIPTENEMDHWWTQSRKCIDLFLLKKNEMDQWYPVKKNIPIPTEKNMKWIIGEPSQEKCIYLFLPVNPVKKMYIPIPTEIKYEMDHWWTQSRKCIYLFLLKKKWNGSLVNPVKKMYIPIPTEIKYEMDHWWTQSRKCIYLFLLK